jgi:hypothetical protein
MNTLSQGDMNALIILSMFLIVGLIVGGGSLLYDWMARRQQRPHKPSH